MSSIALTGLTAITTINLFENYDVTDFWEDLTKIGSWFQEILPENRFLRFVLYTSGSVFLVRGLPVLLRKTSFFDYFDKEIHFFHRTTTDPDIIAFKAELLKDFADDLPLFDEKLNILELNIGSGTNASFYPEGANLIGTDISEDSREQLEDNFLLDEKIVLRKFIHTSPEELKSIPDETISCVVCFYALCSTRTPSRALNEMKRVLMKDGKVFFIEHTRTKERFTWMWLTQLNFSVQLMMYGCSLKDIEGCFDKAGFAEVVYKHGLWTTRNLGPMHSLRPHVYGFARK